VRWVDEQTVVKRDVRFDRGESLFALVGTSLHARLDEKGQIAAGNAFVIAECDLVFASFPPYRSNDFDSYGNVILRIEEILVDVSTGQHNLEFVGIGSFDGFLTEEFDRVPFPHAIDKRPVKVRIFNDGFQLFFLQRFRVLFPAPRSDFPAGLSIKGGDPGQALRCKLPPVGIRAFVQHEDRCFESTTANRDSDASQSRDRPEIFGPADSLQVLCDKFVGCLRRKSARTECKAEYNAKGDSRKNLQVMLWERRCSVPFQGPVNSDEVTAP
jgi:hypothetical protein